MKGFIHILFLLLPILFVVAFLYSYQGVEFSFSKWFVELSNVFDDPIAPLNTLREGFNKILDSFRDFSVTGNFWDFVYGIFNIINNFFAYIFYCTKAFFEFIINIINTIINLFRFLVPTFE